MTLVWWLLLAGIARGADAGTNSVWFSPPTSPPLPAVIDATWARTPIDRFILSRLETFGLHPSSEASWIAWLRRVTLDLIGLPPTPEETAGFLADVRPDAFERVVERLLGSPRYGERWAQHWLDVVRYADTHGFEVNTERPNAWPYRDYVISALNRDLPYDRFVREQLAGDSLGNDAATGFLVTASVLLPGQIGADEESKRLARQDSLDEIVVNTGQTFLGLSIGCARCHDHKFDPILSRDYYAMQAFFAGVEYEEREIRSAETEETCRERARLKQDLATVELELSRFEPLARPGAENLRRIDSRTNRETFTPRTAKFLRFTIQDTNRHPTLGVIEPCLDEVEVFTDEAMPRNVALASLGTRVTASGSRTSDRHRLEHVNDGRFGNDHSWMSDEAGRGWLLFEFPEAIRISSVVWSRDREGQFTDRTPTAFSIEVGPAVDSLETVAGLSPSAAGDVMSLGRRRKELESRIELLSVSQRVFAGAFRKPDAIRRLRRGDPEQPLEPVAPGVPGALGTLALSEDAPEAERRLALANWLARPDHPLTARVLVNRIWQGHFGTGIVETPSDFGHNGARPSHPELLDWLASELVRRGGSLKALHRLIVLSATYRQSVGDSGSMAKGLKLDSGDRLLWRFPSRRLESEVIRDSMVSVSGRLDFKAGGRGFDLFNQRGGLSGFKPVESYQGEGLRRMIYAHKVRREREAVFGAFDCPDAGQSTARRRESTTPLQALNLFNSRFTLEASEALARRVRMESGAAPKAQVKAAYQLALSRPLEPDEETEAVAFIQTHGLPGFCRALFNCNEFLVYP